MVTNLDRCTIGDFIARPGIALVSWYSPRHPLSRLFDVDYLRVSARHPNVGFGEIDVTKAPSLAATWGVAYPPELRAYRDGTLVFKYSGALPEGVVEALIAALSSLKWQPVRIGSNGG